jgi:hypothetical protein
LKAGDATRSPDTSEAGDASVAAMKRLLLLAVLVALGMVAARKLRDA